MIGRPSGHVNDQTVLDLSRKMEAVIILLVIDEMKNFDGSEEVIGEFIIAKSES